MINQTAESLSAGRQIGLRSPLVADARRTLMAAARRLLATIQVGADRLLAPVMPVTDLALTSGAPIDMIESLPRSIPDRV